ncbi:serine/threonine-protein kinase pim-3-like, partial [Silurus meridionalis]
VKPENIMVQTNTLEVKLIDFGCGDLIKDKYKEFAGILSESSAFCMSMRCVLLLLTGMSLTGTPSYAPPEWFKKKKYLAEPATVWSVGVTLYRLVCGSLPFNTRKDVKHGHVRFSRSHSEG